MRVNYFLGALGELLQRMDSPAARYGLALPAHGQFIGLINRLPDWSASDLVSTLLSARRVKASNRRHITTKSPNCCRGQVTMTETKPVF